MNTHVIPLLALIVAIGIFFGYVNPEWTGTIATARANIASDDAALTAANAYSAQQNQLTSAQDAISPSDLTQLTAFLPDSVNNVGLILDLNALAARSGLALSNVDVANNGAADIANNTASSTVTTASSAGSSSAGPVGSVDLSLSAIGTYASLQNFLAGVEQSERLLDVRDLTVKGSDTGAYNYQMTIRLYWLL